LNLSYLPSTLLYDISGRLHERGPPAVSGYRVPGTVAEESQDERYGRRGGPGRVAGQAGRR
jgi:hypothetical protein